MPAKEASRTCCVSSGKRSDSSSSEEERTIELESSSLLRKKVDGVLAVKECWFSGVHSDM